MSLKTDYENHLPQYINSSNKKDIIKNISSFLNKPYIFNKTIGEMLVLFVYVLFVCSFVIIKHNPFNILSLIVQSINYMICFFTNIMIYSIVGSFIIFIIAIIADTK
jgi:uncharacterized phage infection (PIP) family protein YhgE